MPSLDAFQNMDRSIFLQDALDEILRRTEADFNAKGFSTTEILDALGEVLDDRRVAVEEDPDPAENEGDAP